MKEKAIKDVSIILLLTGLVMLGTYTLRLKDRYDKLDTYATKMTHAWASCEYQKELLENGRK